MPIYGAISRPENVGPVERVPGTDLPTIPISMTSAAITASEMKIKRAAYRANHRGTKELDFLLGPQKR